MHLALFIVFSITSLTFAQSNPKTFSIMSYNAENLFDAKKHDENKNDYPCLPIALKKGIYKKETETACLYRGPVGSAGFFECVNTDWSEQVFNTKLVNIGKVIAMYDNGKGADMVVMEEIENQNVMNNLLEKVKPLGYKYTLLLEDRDSRGIDVGIISKYPIVSSKLHSSDPASGVKRGIYQFNMNVDGAKVVVLGNQSPSQNNPPEDRMDASELLSNVASSITGVDVVVSVGDFNTLDTDKPNPIHVIYDKHLDVKPEAEKLGVKIFPGTYKFRGKWDTLDRFLIRKADMARGKVKPMLESFEIINNNELLKGGNSGFQSQTNSGGGFQGGGRLQNSPRRDSIALFDGDPSKAPVRFNPKNGQGYSDHLPIAMKFQLTR